MIMDTILDPNNNAPGEKSYSLRPRASLKKDEEETELEEPWKPRGRVKRRSKQKGLPLSKYRRKTANARERSRMREINEAFEALRRALPHFNCRADNPGEKTTKIMTLRLAMKYITALDSALRQADFDSDGESLVSDYGMTPPASREHSLTPSSLSEQSDIFDQLFITSSFDDFPSSASSSSCTISPFLKDTLKSPVRNSPTATKRLESLQSFPKPISFVPTTQSAKLLQLVPSEASLTPSTTRSTTSKTPSLPSYPLLIPSTPMQTDCFPPLVDQGKDSLPPMDLQDYAATSWREFDCLPSSPMNLDDLFIT